MGMMTRRNVQERAVQSAPLSTKKTETPKKVEEPKKVAKTPEELLKEKGVTKTEINRMTTADLQSFAGELGIDGADELSGNKIKKLLCEMLEG